MKGSAVFRPCTWGEQLMAFALERCSFAPGTFAKRFARELAWQVRDRSVITEKQADLLRKLVRTYRRQIRADALQPEDRHLLSRAR